MMNKLTRRVIIEKIKCINPIFPTTMKGMYDSLYFFESIGGRGLYFNGINNPNIESTIKRANQIWHQLNHHTLEEIKTIVQKD